MWHLSLYSLPKRACNRQRQVRRQCMNPISAASDQKDTPKSAALSRRSLLRGSSAIAIAAGAATVWDESAHAQSPAPHPAMRSGQNAQIAAIQDAGTPTLPNIAVIALTRMAFGATPTDWGDFAALGTTSDERLVAYVDQQLNPDAIDDSACDAIIAKWGFTTLNKTQAQ